MDTDYAPSPGLSPPQNWLLWSMSSLCTCKVEDLVLPATPNPLSRPRTSRSLALSRCQGQQQLLPPLRVPGPPDPGLAFLDVERIGIGNRLCFLASAAPAGPLLSLHPGRAHRARASPEVPEMHLLRGCPHHPRLPPPPGEAPQVLARVSSSNQARRSEWKGVSTGWGALSGSLLHCPLHPVSCRKESKEAKTI